MYLEHFGLHSKPFSLSPDPAYIYLSSQHSLAYYTLEYGLLSQEGIAVISGEVGAGKTTLLRYFLEQHDGDDLVVALLADTDRETSKDLLRWVLSAFGLDHTGDQVTLRRRFQDFLIESYAAGKNAVLIVDEAQNLKKKALEQLRLLNNINTGQDELLKIVLVGQPELKEKLSSPKLRQFAQRITVEFHLDSLRAEDALGYVHHRMQVAGADHEIFSSAAIYTAYYLAGGVPRLINSLCDHALLLAYSKGTDTVDIEAITESASSRKIGGVNRKGETSEQLEIARDYVKSATGREIGEDRRSAILQLFDN